VSLWLQVTEWKISHLISSAYDVEGDQARGLGACMVMEHEAGKLSRTSRWTKYSVGDLVSGLRLTLPSLGGHLQWHGFEDEPGLVNHSDEYPYTSLLLGRQPPICSALYS